MKRVIIRDQTIIPPFGEPARDLRILNKPLWVLQRDLLSQYCRGALLEVDSLTEIPRAREELLVHRDNLFFNDRLITTFIAQAREQGRACQIAFARTDKAIVKHALPLQDGIRLAGDVYVADLFYFPDGPTDEIVPLVIDTQPREMGYYNIPQYMAYDAGELVFHVPQRAFLSIESWVHVFTANTPFGVFAWGRAHEQLVEESWKEKVAVSMTALWEQLNPLAPKWRNHFLACSRLVKVGKNCSIDPTAVIHGPTVIGNNVTIGAGVVITNSLIGNNVTIMQGCQVMLSVVSDRCYLPWNAALFMTTFMENTMVAQLTCLQMCVVGRNTFIGAGNIFTDYDLLGKPLQTFHRRRGATEPRLEDVGMPVVGSAVGHNVKIGSGFVFYPGRMIGSNTTLIYAEPATAIKRNINIRFDDDQPAIPNTADDAQPDDTQQTVFVWPDRYTDEKPAAGNGAMAIDRLELSMRDADGMLHRRIPR